MGQYTPMVEEERIYSLSGYELPEVPEPFADLSSGEYARLYGLLDEHISHLRMGCRVTLLDLLKIRTGKINKRLDEITELAKLPDRKTTSILVFAATRICIESKTPEDIMQKIKGAYEKRTAGKQSTGNREADLEVLRIIRFSVLTSSIFWKAWNKKPPNTT